MPLVPLVSQEIFERLWFHSDPTQPLPDTRPSDRGWILYHTAKWCGACKRVDLPAVVAAAEEKGLTIWKVDQDENDYTSGYCGVRSIPTWQFCIPNKLVSTLQSGQTPAIQQWIASLPSQ